ncbi:type II toxin-antitoxin system RelE/ParE family toxin [Piscinibacter terrae]|uniref:Type II toxin-antitoxin system RelE/ParE family toxin n=1 Tax=Piscinibacter terrae TaxID=2496871 RepID=A0A3N7JUH7_9BURK|nr:type II toxin-antitoxin system RelE/ParE family toxin [Albitalea terrae]RQP24549.1 type II toxin-antitoxin system RelE/ParE family toxin [Albitalea terrae]
MKRTLLREAAERDVERGFSHYLEEAGADIALAFIEEIDTALEHIERHPGTGSPRYGELFDFPGLRCWLVSRFPYALFYVEHDEYLDVIRVLHQQSEIPAQLPIE